MKYKIDLVITGVESDGTESYRAKYVGTENDSFDGAIAFIGSVERSVKRDDRLFIKESVFNDYPCGECELIFNTQERAIKHRILNHIKIGGRNV